MLANTGDAFADLSGTLNNHGYHFQKKLGSPSEMTNSFVEGAHFLHGRFGVIVGGFALNTAYGTMTGESFTR